LQAETLLSLLDRLGPMPRWSSWLARTYSALTARSTVRGWSARPGRGASLLPPPGDFERLVPSIGLRVGLADPSPGWVDSTRLRWEAGPAGGRRIRRPAL